MEAVGDLTCLRGSLPSSFHVIPPAIPADDFYSWVSWQPVFQGVSFTVWQQVDRDVLFLDPPGSSRRSCLGERRSRLHPGREASRKQPLALFESAAAAYQDW